jgi:hypothetical protein
MASRPVAARVTSYPCFWSRRARPYRFSSSSSTTSKEVGSAPMT